ncbi:hypothetical protein [Rhodoferax mekongensis]|uniref:Uncharacterized protein n=1 Tax=Rhodoferax mekongensis TaxID=3068341 RepID=A0ABZ0B2G7_9BURK|nr:hypothetical protein [Rhodoferax sp. TBRC 17307]WNO06011.1 hypothetical protein RAN89_06165 [Rhodoferax sp. TBRC 17307]
MSKRIKCAWCGFEFDLTKKGRPKQHKDGIKTCSGSGQHADTHKRLRDAAQKNAKDRHEQTKRTTPTH